MSDDPRLDNPTPNDPAPNDPAPNDPAPNDPAPNVPAPNVPAPNDLAPNDLAPNDPAPNDPAPNGPTSDDHPQLSLPGMDSTTHSKDPAAATTLSADDKSPAATGALADTDDRLAAPRPAAAGPRIKIGSQRDQDAAADVMKARPQFPGQVPAATDSDTGAPGSPTEPPAPANPSFPPPRLDRKLSPDLQREVEAALSGASIDELISSTAIDTEELPEGAQASGRVLSVRGDGVIVELGRRHQGIVPTRQFEQPPEVGTALNVAVSRFNSEDGVYELVLPDAAVGVSGWDELSEGMVVQAMVTGHNKGGLECEVNKLRGFIPASHVSLYRVANLEQFVGQKLPCVVTEVKPERRNLVLSHRAVLERERAEAKEQLIKELAVGQIREGVVTRLQPFGAFVDLGGIDGLVHVSQLGWDRVSNPAEILEVGQRIQVKVNKIDPKTGKIGLGYRDLFENPWTKVPDKYKPKTQVHGTISKLMDFGAFVRLEPGVEGLIHVSEIAHQRVWRPSDMLSEGQEVDVMVLSVDSEQQRISLSLKALQARPEKPSDKKKDRDEDIPVPSPPLPKQKHPNRGLKGGTNRRGDGEEFGLKW